MECPSRGGGWVKGDSVDGLLQEGRDPGHYAEGLAATGVQDVAFIITGGG